MLSSRFGHFLVLGLTSVTSAQSYRFETIVESASAEGFFAPGLNSSGVVAFARQDPSGPEREVWRIENGQAQVIVPASMGFKSYLYGPRVAENGDVLVDASDFIVRELWLWDESLGQLRLVADAASTQAVTGLPGYHTWDLNDFGKVALIGGPNLGDLLVWDDGILSLLGGTGDFDTFNDVAIANDGTVYAIGRRVSGWVLAKFPPVGLYQVLDTMLAGHSLQEESGTLYYVANGTSIRRYDATNGAVDLIAVDGSGPILLGNPYMLSLGSAAGPVVFQGQAVGPPSLSGLFTGPDPNVDRVLQTGDCVTGGVAGAIFSSQDSIDANGRVVFTVESSGFPGNGGRRVILATPDTPGPGQVVCEGTAAAGANCPCLNNANGCLTGCRNSNGGAAQLLGYGSASVAADDLHFQANGLPYGKPALLFGGLTKLNGDTGIALGEGLLCAGNVARLSLALSSSAGTAEWGAGVLGSSPFSAGTQVVFQTWYRDPELPPNGPCTPLGYNLSNGYELTLIP